MTKKHFHTSLQLKLTLLLSLLMIVSCVLMYFFISHSAVSGMDGIAELHDQGRPTGWRFTYYL